MIQQYNYMQKAGKLLRNFYKQLLMYGELCSTVVVLTLKKVLECQRWLRHQALTSRGLGNGGGSIPSPAD